MSLILLLSPLQSEDNKNEHKTCVKNKKYVYYKIFGQEHVSIEEWCGYLGELIGVEPKFDFTENTIPPLALDPTLMHEKLGATRVAWRDGIRRMLEARNPELLRAP